MFRFDWTEIIKSYQIFTGSSSESDGESSASEPEKPKPTPKFKPYETL